MSAVFSRLSTFRPLENADLPDARVSVLLNAPKRSVRPLSRLLQHLTAEGARRAPTFAAILLGLEASDVIVHIVEAPNLPPSRPARTMLAVVTDRRILRIEMGQRQTGHARLALLGHELFHALEIANAPEVRDPRTLAALYRRIGFRIDLDQQQFETREATQVEKQIRRELDGLECR
jgi:hypothetical protein